MRGRNTVALILACLSAACGKTVTEPLEIPFIATWNGVPIACEGAAGQISLSDLRLYISQLQLLDIDGRAREIQLSSDVAWQNDAVALIDLETGEGACQNGTPQHYGKIIGAAPGGDYQALKFTIGVPFDLNHANPLTASAPLDDSDMHWHWRSGYKFLRAGVRAEQDGFWIHTGSAGCEGTVGNITACRFPNRVNVHLDGFVPGQSVIAIDLAELFAGVNLEDGNPGDCSSGPAESACAAPFAALGIDFNTGEQTDSQRVFSLQ